MRSAKGASAAGSAGSALFFQLFHGAAVGLAYRSGDRRFVVEQAAGE
jgi:hypothetical protein